MSGSDGDGIGQFDADDDNDEWTDADEIRAGTDPLDPNDTPVDSFEIQIGNIGLGAWDLIGIFGGLPIFVDSLRFVTVTHVVQDMRRIWRKHNPVGIRTGSPSLGIQFDVTPAWTTSGNTS